MVIVVVFTTTLDCYQRIIDIGEDMKVTVLNCILQLAINLFIIDMQSGSKTYHTKQYLASCRVDNNLNT
jgi:hypothetical protein